MHFYIRYHRNLHNTDRPVLAQMRGCEFQRDASGNDTAQVNIFLLDSAGRDDSLWVTVMTEGSWGGLVSYSLASLYGLLKLSVVLWSIEPCPCCCNVESQKCGEKEVHQEGFIFTVFIATLQVVVAAIKLLLSWLHHLVPSPPWSTGILPQQKKFTLLLAERHQVSVLLALTLCLSRFLWKVAPSALPPN